MKHGPMRESCDKNSPFAIYVRPDCPRVGPARLPRVRTGPVPVGRPRPEHAARVLFLNRGSASRVHMGFKKGHTETP